MNNYFFCTIFMIHFLAATFYNPSTYFIAHKYVKLNVHIYNRRNYFHKHVCLWRVGRQATTTTRHWLSDNNSSSDDNNTSSGGNNLLSSLAYPPTSMCIVQYHITRLVAKTQVLYKR